jgi:hypothetical protein
MGRLLGIWERISSRTIRRQATSRLQVRFPRLVVTGHESVGPDHDLVCTAPLSHQLQVAAVILAAKERTLSANSLLGNAVRQTRNHDTPQSGHDRRL